MIKRTKKECKGVPEKIDPHKDYLWSGGRCKRCHTIFKSIEEDNNEGPRPAVKKLQKPIRKRTKKNQNDMDKENAACLKYWKSKADINGDVYCEETGRWVGTEEHMEKSAVAHIWSKGSNTYYRSDLRNMIILHPDLHDILDARADDAMLREVFPKNYNRIKETIRKLNLEYHDTRNRK